MPPISPLAGPHRERCGATPESRQSTPCGFSCYGQNFSRLMISWDDPDRSGLRSCLGAQNRVFEGLRGPQTYYRLRLDLDGLAGLGVAAHARFTMGFDCTSEVWNDEFARAALAFLHRQFEELFKKCTHRLFRRLALLRQMAHYLRLAHWLCHLVLFPPLAFVSFEPSWRPEPGPHTRDTIKRVPAQRKRKCKKAAKN